MFVKQQTHHHHHDHTRNPRTINIYHTIHAAYSILDELWASTGGGGKGDRILHSILVMVKVQIETEGIVTTCGSLVPRGNVPGEEAVVVRRLRRGWGCGFGEGDFVWYVCIVSFLGKTSLALVAWYMEV